MCVNAGLVDINNFCTKLGLKRFANSYIGGAAKGLIAFFLRLFNAANTCGNGLSCPAHQPSTQRISGGGRRRRRRRE